MRLITSLAVTLVAGTVLVPLSAFAADKDYGGMDLTINANTTLDGRQFNIRNLVIAKGVTVTVTPGLALEFDVANADVQGTIDANGAGFTGGMPGSDGMTATGGLGGMGPGGGGKGANGLPGGGAGGAGGGGGGHGGIGGTGGGGYSTCTNDRPAGGMGGATVGSPNARANEMGAGGGGGGGAYISPACTAPNVIMNRSGAPGGAGGGQVTIVAQQNLNVSGSILADGKPGGLGGTSGCGGAGSGGGGAGGGILLDGAVVRFSGTMSANGGAGGDVVCAGVGCALPTMTTCNPVSMGQAGGGGRIKIFGVAVPINTGAANVGGANPGTSTVTLTSPSASLMPPSTGFGNQRVGTTSAPATVTVNNAGNGPLVISNVFVAGSNPGDFVVKTPPLPWSIPAMGSGTFTVTFTPTVVGNRAATVQLSTNDLMNTTLKEALTGTGVFPIATVTPSAIHFGNQLIATASMPQAVTIANTGTDTLTVTKIAINGANAGDFATSGVPNLPFSIAPGASVMFGVTFTPAAAGPRSAELDVTDDTGVQMVALDGVGAAPRMVVMPPTAFGPQRPGTTTMATITIANQGTGPLQVTKIALSGAAAADYMLVNAPMLPATVAPGMSATFNVSFNPSMLGLRPATLTITGSDPKNPTATVNLNGSGVQPSITVAPPKVAFADQPVKTTSKGHTVTITNLGTDDLHVSNIVLGGNNAADFGLANLPKLPATVPPGTSTTFDITFSPTAAGARSAQAVVMSDDPNTPGLMIPLSGNGTAPNISVTPMSIDFGMVQVGLQHAVDVVIANNGTDVLNVVGAMITGSNNFTIVNGPMFPQVIPPGGMLSLSIGYAPSAVAMDSGKLTVITDNLGMPNFEVPLTGTGITASFMVSPMSMDFGAIPIGKTSPAQKVTITNSGATNFNLASATFVGPGSDAFHLLNPPALPQTIQPGASISLDVVFVPTAHMTQNATLLLQTDVPNAMPGAVVLTGMGLQAGLGASPLKLDFGTVVVGGASEGRTVTVRNTGDAPLALGQPMVSGSGANGYKIDFTVPPPLLPGETATITITFAPPAAGGFNATLEVVSTDQLVPPIDIVLTGVGFDAHLDAQPISLDFGAVAVGGAMGPYGVSVRNRASVPQQILGVASDAGDFVVSNQSLPITLGPGEATILEIAFKPTHDGFLHATVSVDTNFQKGAALINAQGNGIPYVSGGGCSCGVTGRPTRSPAPLLVASLCLALAATLLRRRRSR